ncbi:hypothetical protein DB29_00974 [Shouchella clausii]|nr:hypothetical protein DB29_00974 [Shouchella clausii]
MGNVERQEASLAFFVNFMNKINNMHLMNVILKTVTLS